MDLRDRLGLEHPIFQAGMGGGLATSDLAGAVSRAGALGTIGMLRPSRMAGELRRARELAPSRPIAANLLLPFARRAHFEACVAGGARAVVLFFGFHRRGVARLRDAGIVVVHQVGTADEARRAIADGADALIAQGREAGGHLLGLEPALATLARVRDVADGAPVLVAGGVATSVHVRDALRAGAAGVVCGSRFLLTEECRAHRGYKARALGARETREVELFAIGWPARHRVLPNEATERWCKDGARPPWLARGAASLSAPLAKLVPVDERRLARLQRPSVPLFTPSAPLDGDDDRLLEAAPLYAGACVRDVTRVAGAEDTVRDLARGVP